MATARMLIVYPASLHGGYWATGPRVKAELVSLHTALSRAGVEAGVVDVENEIGNPGANDREAFIGSVERLLASSVAAPAGVPGAPRPAAPWRVEDADLLVISCSSSLQYTATLAVAGVARRLYPELPIAVAGFHVTARPADFTYDGAPFDRVVVGEPETALVELARTGRGEILATPATVEGTPLDMGPGATPDFAAYPYALEGLTVLQVFLSRGCPFPLAACRLQPGSPGWRAFSPDVAGEIIAGMTALRPGRIEALDPSFGLEPAWRGAILEILARDAESRRTVPLVIKVRPEAFTRRDVDAAYRAGLELRLDVGTLSAALLERTGAVPRPSRHVEHALDLLGYVNAKGLVAHADFVFNRPGETRGTARETLDVLESFVDEVPNTSVRLSASSWVYVPFADVAAEVDGPRERYGTVILHPEWWREGIASERAAKAVVASRDLADLEAGDESYWRPRFDAIVHKLTGKLTQAAKRGSRSHESVGSEASGVPQGFWVEPHR